MPPMQETEKSPGVKRAPNHSNGVSENHKTSSSAVDSPNSLANSIEFTSHTLESMYNDNMSPEEVETNVTEATITDSVDDKNESSVVTSDSLPVESYTLPLHREDDALTLYSRNEGKSRGKQSKTKSPMDSKVIVTSAALIEGAAGEADESLMLLDSLDQVHISSPTELIDGPNAPDKRLKLKKIYGFNAHSISGNMEMLATGEIVYHIASYVIIWDTETDVQRYFKQHEHEVCSLAVYTGEIIASAEFLYLRSTEAYVRITIWSSENMSIFAQFNEPIENQRLIGLYFAPNVSTTQVK